MIVSAGRYIKAVFLIILLLSIGSLFFTFFILASHQQSDNLVARTHEVIRGLDELTLLITDSEALQRNYLLTNTVNDLERYKKDLPIITKQILLIKELTKDNPSQQKNIHTLQLQITNRIARLDEGITIEQTQGTAAVQAFLQHEKGTPIMTAISRQIVLMKAEESKRLSQREKQSEYDYTFIYFSVLSSVLLNVCLLCLAYYLTIKELNNRTLQDQRKDEFINIASHELKTPITSQRVYAQLLKKELASSNLKQSKAYHYADQIDAQTQRLLALITDMLDMSRIQLGKLQLERTNFNITELLTDTTEAIQGTTKKHQLIFTSKRKYYVYADRYRIYQVLVNLLTNAIKYSPAGGKIIIHIKKKGSFAVVSIKDFGLGIAAEHQKRIFDRLYQVSETQGKTYSGLGIGLYISCQIIKEHEGDIRVESKEGHGSTFFVSIPLLQQDVRIPQKPHTPL